MAFASYLHVTYMLLTSYLHVSDQAPRRLSDGVNRCFGVLKCVLHAIYMQHTSLNMSLTYTIY